MSERKKPNLTDKAYALIRQDIVTCGLRPGASMTEQQFRDRYRLTVAITRAALSRLVHDGLVVAEPRRGYVVAPLTLRDVIEVFDARIAIEAAAIRMAIDALTPESIAAMEAAAKVLSGPGAGASAFVPVNRTFHLSIAQATGNRRMVKILERLIDESERVLHLGLVKFDNAIRYRDDHLGLVELIRARREEEAAQQMCAHIDDGKQMVLMAIRSSSQFMSLDVSDLAVRPEKPRMRKAAQV